MGLAKLDFAMGQMSLLHYRNPLGVLEGDALALDKKH